MKVEKIEIKKENLQLWRDKFGVLSVEFVLSKEEHQKITNRKGSVTLTFEVDEFNTTLNYSEQGVT